MIQFLEILGDVMRVATFQWFGDKPHDGRGRERPNHADHWRPAADRYPVRRPRP